MDSSSSNSSQNIQQKLASDKLTFPHEHSQSSFQEDDNAVKHFMSLEPAEQISAIKEHPDIVNKYQSRSKNTPLFLAVQGDKYELAKVLLDNGANPNFQNKYGETPLHKAVEIGNHKMINLLLENQADPNIRKEHGDTPMHIAAGKGDYKVIKLLLLYEADQTITNENNCTAKDYASDRGYSKCVEVLEKASATANPKKKVLKPTRSDGNIKFKLDEDDKYNEAIANGMEKTPDHASREKLSSRVFSDTRVHKKNNSTDIATKKEEQVNTLSSFVNEGNDKNKRHINIDHIDDDSNNNIFILNSQANNECNSTQENNATIPIEQPFPEIRRVGKTENLQGYGHDEAEIYVGQLNMTKSLKKNQMAISRISTIVQSDNLIDKITLGEYFYDNSEPLTKITSSLNDIIVDTYIRESTIKMKVMKNNTLVTSRREESTIQGEYQRAENENAMENDNEDSVFVPSPFNPNEGALNDYLINIRMGQYTKLLIKEGFDDVGMLIGQMRSKKGITDDNLKKIGINKPGHRARILIKLQLDAENFGCKFNNQINTESIFYVSNKNVNNFKEDSYLLELYQWLKDIKLDNLFTNFFYNGYHSVDLLMMQMLSKNPITEELLESDLNVFKFGHRLRLIAKLTDDSAAYFNKYRLSASQVDFERESETNSSCQCKIF